MRVGAIIGIPLALLGTAFFLPLGQYLEQLTGWIQGLGPWGPLVYVLLYAVGTVAALPISILAACAGFLFGPATAMLALVAGALLGACLAFALARTVARETVQAWLPQNPRLARLDQAIERHGPMVVALARVTPGLPFGIMNYALGLSGVPASTYVIYTFLGVLPGSALNAVGSATLAQMLRTGAFSWPLLALVLILVLLAVALSRYASRWL